MKRVLGLLAILGLLACEDPNNHLLEGQEYDPQGNCLGPPSAIDDLPGQDPGDTCAPSCIVAMGEDASALFITTTCPPFPGYSSEAEDAAMKTGDPCKAALALFNDTDAGACSAEAGSDAASDAPLDGPRDGANDALEAGPDAEAGADATMPSEAGTEAAAESGADATQGD